MALPKDWIVYIEKDTNETRADIISDYTSLPAEELEKKGHKVIGYISSGSMAEAIQYGNEVLR
jgi:hypothetical protein